MSNNRDRHVLRKLINHIDHTLDYCEGVDFDAFMNYNGPRESDQG